MECVCWETLAALLCFPAPFVALHCLAKGGRVWTNVCLTVIMLTSVCARACVCVGGLFLEVFLSI